MNAELKKELNRLKKEYKDKRLKQGWHVHFTYKVERWYFWIDVIENGNMSETFVRALYNGELDFSPDYVALTSKLLKNKNLPQSTISKCKKAMLICKPIEKIRKEIEQIEKNSRKEINEIERKLKKEVGNKEKLIKRHGKQIVEIFCNSTKKVSKERRVAKKK